MTWFTGVSVLLVLVQVPSSVWACSFWWAWLQLRPDDVGDDHVAATPRLSVIVVETG